jgi:hypothetical protein
MRRWLYIAAFDLILLTLPAWAQHGGGHASGGGSASHSSVSHSSRFSSHASGFASHSFGSGVSAGVGHYNGYAGAGPARSFSRNAGSRVRIGDRNIGGRDRDRHRFRGWSSFYPYYGYSPYGFYDPYYSGYMGSGYQRGDDSADADAGQYSTAPSREREDDGLQRDVQTLSGKIDRLQADVEARNRPRAEQEPMTALVFRDQHVEEVRNYAISGGTLWVLNEQSAKKIPLAQLDLDATARMNDNRGVDFQVPK